MIFRSAAAAAVSPIRIGDTLDALGAVGRDADGAISRVCFTEPEEEAHRLVAKWMGDLGLEVERDPFGNTVGSLEGTGGRTGAIGIGSHVDSVPRGGNYDGAVGVVGALEAVRALREAGVRLHHDLTVVAFSAEEGARFGTPCLGSKAAIGDLGEDDLLRLRDRSGVTLADAIAGRGSDPAAVVNGSAWAEGVAAFLELHIEQGRVLESSGQAIGVVDWIAGNRRMRMRLEGRTDHSGATPMGLRADALVAAAEVVLEVEGLARRARGLVGTVGEFTVWPGGMTAVPGRVEMSVDVRSADVVLQEETMHAVVAGAARRCTERGIDLDMRDVSSVAPIMLPAWLRRLLVGSARRVVESPRVMTSGAGHDAAILARRMPAGMVFVPCRDGVSHSPEEWASPEQVATGTAVLVEAMLDLDAALAGAGGVAA